MDRDFFLRNLWRWKCGLPEQPVDGGALHRFTYEQATQNWDSDFIRFMQNRMVLGIYRYGSFRDPNQPRYDRVSSIRKRLEQYARAGNAEHLVDIASLAMIEFARREHALWHFNSVDDGIHTEVARQGGFNEDCEG